MTRMRWYREDPCDCARYVSGSRLLLSPIPGSKGRRRQQHLVAFLALALIFGVVTSFARTCCLSCGTRCMTSWLEYVSVASAILLSAAWFQRRDL